MSNIRSSYRGVVLLEAVAAIMVTIPLCLFGWGLSNYYQMYHQLSSITDTEFKFGAGVTVHAVMLGDDAGRETLNLDQIFSSKLLRIREEICTKLLFNKECSSSIEVKLLYAGRLYLLNAPSIPVAGSGPGITDNQIIVTTKISNQFKNLRTLTGKYFDTTLVIKQTYQVRGGMIWIG